MVGWPWEWGGANYPFDPPNCNKPAEPCWKGYQSGTIHPYAAQIDSLSGGDNCCAECCEANIPYPEEAGVDKVHIGICSGHGYENGVGTYDGGIWSLKAYFAYGDAKVLSPWGGESICKHQPGAKAFCALTENQGHASCATMTWNISKKGQAPWVNQQWTRRAPFARTRFALRAVQARPSVGTAREQGLSEPQ